MSRTNKHSRQQKLNQFIDSQQQDFSNIEYRRAWTEFWSGPIRHGNKRHYEAYMKWKRHKAERYDRNRIDPQEMIED